MFTQLLDPNLAYFLLVAGLVMGILALFSPGTGLLEVGAFFALILAGIGIASLEINGWALLLLLVGGVPFVIALRRRRQIGFLVLTIATVIVGSIFLFCNAEGGPAVHPLLAVVTSLLVISILWFVGRKGLEAIAQKPTFDLDDLVGKIGDARTQIQREGTVYLDGEEWTARSNRVIPLGSKVRVISRDGIILVVEPVLNQAVGEIETLA